MPATYEPIATTTLSSAASTITFSSIPSTYTDLRVIVVYQGSTANAGCYMRFNSDTGSNYSQTTLTGDGSTAGSGRTTNATYLDFQGGAYASTTVPAFQAWEIFSYAGSTNKTVLSADSGDRNGSGGVSRCVGLWRNTAAITTITLTGTNTLAAGSTATLYGILKA